MLGYDEALEVLTRHDVFSSAFGTGPISELDSYYRPGHYNPAQPTYNSLNLCDPPAHTVLRKHLEEWIAAHPLKLDKKLFGPLAEGGDITESILRGLPRQTLRAMLEVDEELAAYLQDIGLRLAYAEDFALVQEAARQRWHSAEEELEEAFQRVQCRLGSYLARGERHHLWRLLVLASLESTTTALAHMMLQLCRTEGWQQAQQRRAHFVEELLRNNPPLHRFGRLTLKAHRLGETQIEAGQRVVVFFAAANCRAREGQNHLSFGAGPHRCPGSGMARRILKALLDACLELPQAPRLQEPPEFFWSSFQLTPRSFKLARPAG